MWAESTAKGGVKERRTSPIYTLNFETKSILSDRAWVNLESSGIFFCVFLGFGYKITDKPRIPSDNLDPASTDNSVQKRPQLDHKIIKMGLLIKEY